MIIDGREIGQKHLPYIVAEIGAGHGGTLDSCINLIDAAKKAGADACKLQTYTAEALTISCDRTDFIIQDGPWKGRTLFELYKSAKTPKEWHKTLFEYAGRIGINIFSTPFSIPDVDFLESLNCPAYKVASFEIGFVELLDRVKRTGKPVIISTGMADDEDISAVNERFVSYGNFALLHCVSGYPVPVEEANLSRIAYLRERILSEVTVGFSDHTTGSIAAICAVALGATILEKHIGFSSSEDGIFAMSRRDFAIYCSSVRDAWRSIQHSDAKSQTSSHQMRRSIYIVQDIKVGEKLTTENIRVIRPGYGLKPSRLSEFLGKKAKHDIERGTPLKDDLVE